MSANKQSPIGIYDSGIGGLTVLKTLINQLPNEKFVYFADTANLPYGNKTPDQITQYSHQIIDWFQNIVKAKIVVAACHTSSAIALQTTPAHVTIPIINTIQPILDNLVNNKSHKNIGIIATPASAESGIHARLIKAHGFTGKVISISCPNFVPLIEADSPEADLDHHIALYLDQFKQEQFDTLIFGCTHYPLIKANISKFLPDTMLYIDPAEQITATVINLLAKNSLHNTLESATPELEFYCSKDPDLFTLKIQKLMSLAIQAKLQDLQNIHKASEL
ncbi:MAG: glutamate racemase [Gammaproteobacteria bacterium]|nr:glutamate racemase [Gammaproteobacteria bacterium]